MVEEVREYGEARLIYERIGSEEIIHSYELLQQFKNTTLWLIQVYKDYVGDNEDEYFINKIYRDENGGLWLTRAWVNEVKPKQDVLQIYRIY
jgi:hypothetical protein